MSYYQDQGKQTIADALVKVANSAPGSQIQVGYAYSPANHNISAQEFSNWVNYVMSTLDILYRYSGLEVMLQTKITVSQISSVRGAEYVNLIDQIKNVIYSLARSILQYP